MSAYNRKVLVVSDVDGTMNSSSMEMTCDGEGNLRYALKSFDSYFLDAMRVIRKLGWDLVAISASKLGKATNKAFCDYFGIKYFADEQPNSLRKGELPKDKDGHPIQSVADWQTGLEPLIEEELQTRINRGVGESFFDERGAHPFLSDAGPWAKTYQKVAIERLFPRHADAYKASAWGENAPHNGFPVTMRMYRLMEAIEAFRIDRRAWERKFNAETGWDSIIEPDIEKNPAYRLAAPSGYIEVLYYGNALRDHELLLEYQGLPPEWKRRYPVIFAAPSDAWYRYLVACDLSVKPQDTYRQSAGKDLMGIVENCLKNTLGAQKTLEMASRAWQPDED